MHIDRIDVTFAAEDLAAAAAGLTAAEQAILLPILSPGDKKHLPKIGMKNEALALQIIEVGRGNPDLIPRGIDFAKIDRDILARAQVNPLLIASRRYTGNLEDTRTILGVDIYVAALAIYHSLKRNARTAALRAAVAELTRGFAKARQTEPDPEIPNTGNGSGAIIVP